MMFYEVRWTLFKYGKTEIIGKEMNNVKNNQIEI